MIVYVVFGGMLATTWVQIIKAILLMSGTILLSILVLAHFGFSFGDFFDAVDSRQPSTIQRPGKTSCKDFLQPGLRYKPPVWRARPDFTRHGADLRHCWTATHPGPVLHRARRQDCALQRGLGDGPDRQLLHYDYLPRLRRGDYRRPDLHQGTAAPT